MTTGCTRTSTAPAVPDAHTDLLNLVFGMEDVRDIFIPRVGMQGLRVVHQTCRATREGLEDLGFCPRAACLFENMVNKKNGGTILYGRMIRFTRALRMDDKADEREARFVRSAYWYLHRRKHIGNQGWVDDLFTTAFLEPAGSFVYTFVTGFYARYFANAVSQLQMNGAHWGAVLGDVELVLRTVADHGARCLYEKTVVGMTPIAIALGRGDAACAGAILDIMRDTSGGKRVDVFTGDRFNNTLLHMATFGGSAQCVQLLERATGFVADGKKIFEEQKGIGFNPVTFKNKAYDTSLCMAVTMDVSEVLLMLLQTEFPKGKLDPVVMVIKRKHAPEVSADG
uniref:Uncharacterized protein n=1 Tax=Hemiselmis andersenii TaxID=464988 RepID=A0A6U2CBL8_HEMAN|mmetsp:Transcript_20136/g.46407  ORF Transcript_20136/g.46407 Transcript_20136/m.46407 type:complete len:340 (+) Transcript_20136:241-1260(+)